MSLPVFYSAEISNLACEDICTIRGSEAHHAVAVRRIRPGEKIAVVDGKGRRGILLVQSTEKAALTGQIQAITDYSPTMPQITLVQALAKGGRAEQAVETATEFGVDSIIPWAAERSVVRWESAQKSAKGRSRWEATAYEAAKQARRAYFPQVDELVDSGALAEKISDFVATGAWVLVCHEEAVHSLAQVLTTLFNSALAQNSSQPNFPSRLVYIVGPEGGITSAELAAFQAAGAQAVLLGEHILRSSSAGPWAIAVTRAFLDKSRVK